MFVIGRQRIKTFMEFESDSNSINCIIGVESRDQKHLGTERLFAEILCNNVKDTEANDEGIEPELI